MKKIMLLLKIGFLAASFFFMTSSFQVSAGDEFEVEGGCNTTSRCSYVIGRGCWCNDLGSCNGCYIPSGGGGIGECGTCFKN